MTARTRYFVVVSLLVLTVGVGTGLVAYYVGIPFGGHAQATDEFRLLPRDAAVVAYANVREVMGSSLRQRVKQALPTPPNGQREFEDETGINIETDIDRIVACFDAGQSPAQSAEQGLGQSDVRPGGPLVLARGRFNEVKIEASMRAHGGDVQDYKGKRLVVGVAPRMPHDAHGGHDTAERQLALAFIEPGLVAVGDPRLVRGAVDLRVGGDSASSNGHSLLSNKELMDQIGAMGTANAWAVGRFDAFRGASLPPVLAGRMPAITVFSVSGHVNGGFTGVLRAETRDDEAGNSLRDLVRGGLSLAKLQAGSNPQFQAMIQSLVLGGTGRTVALSFSVPAEVFDALAAMHGRQHSNQQGEQPRDQSAQRP